MAQQTLFNVPSADITPKNKPFYQHQLNFYSIQKMESNAHIVYGLGKGWDAGMNLVDLPIWLGQQPFISINDNNRHKPLYPLLMFSVQKQWVLREDKLTLTTGTQIGPNLSVDISKTQIAMMNYSLVRWQSSRHRPRKFNFWIWLGTDGGLPRPLICSNRVWFVSYNRNVIFCICRHLGIRANSALAS